MRTKKLMIVSGLALCLFALVAGPARANTVTGSAATVDCSGFSLCVTAIDLAIGMPFEIDFTFTLTPSSGPVIPVSGIIDFVGASNPQTVCTTGTWPGSPLTAPYTVTGTATFPTSPSMDTTFNGTSSTSILLSCGMSGTGCPATIGFWKNTKKHPFPSSVQTSGLTIGGVTYTASQLLTILGATGSGNAVAILGKQLVGALINLAAGAQHNATADAAIADAESLLTTNSLNLLTSNVAASSSLGQSLLADEITLDGYNSANFQTCTEGSGLVF